MKPWPKWAALALALALMGASGLVRAQEAATETPAAQPAEPVKPAAKHKPRPKPKPKPKAEPSPTPTPSAAAAPIVLPDPPLPVVQARRLGLDKCAPMLDSMSRETLTTTYDIQSGWHPGAPASHVFQSVAALHRPGNVPDDGLAALIAAPLASGACDGVIVQVFPLAGDCAQAQTLLVASGGKTFGPLLDARIMVDSARRRLFLLPGYANTCIAVAVDSRFAPP